MVIDWVRELQQVFDPAAVQYIAMGANEENWELTMAALRQSKHNPLRRVVLLSHSVGPC